MQIFSCLFMSTCLRFYREKLQYSAVWIYHNLSNHYSIRDICFVSKYYENATIITIHPQYFSRVEIWKSHCWIEVCPFKILNGPPEGLISCRSQQCVLECLYPSALPIVDIISLEIVPISIRNDALL